MAENEKHQINFDELSSDSQFKERINDFNKSINDIKKLIDDLVDNNIYDELSNIDKVRYDLFLSFAINSLFWFYLRTQGKDPNQHDLKNEINRMKEYMAKSRNIHEKKTIMPRIDQAAAKRFVRAGLFDPNEKTQPEAEEGPSGVKRKRENSNDD